MCIYFLLSKTSFWIDRCGLSIDTHLDLCLFHDMYSPSRSPNMHAHTRNMRYQHIILALSLALLHGCKMMHVISHLSSNNHVSNPHSITKWPSSVIKIDSATAQMEERGREARYIKPTGILHFEESSNQNKENGTGRFKDLIYSDLILNGLPFPKSLTTNIQFRLHHIIKHLKGLKAGVDYTIKQNGQYWILEEDSTHLIDSIPGEIRIFENGSHVPLYRYTPLNFSNFWNWIQKKTLSIKDHLTQIYSVWWDNSFNLPLHSYLLLSLFGVMGVLSHIDVFKVKISYLYTGFFFCFSLSYIFEIIQEFLEI